MSYNFSDYLNGLSSEARARYLLKLSVIGQQTCPFRLPADIWENDPTQWPNMMFGDLYCYLIDTPGAFNREAMKSYRSLEAHRYFRAGFVHTVYHMKTELGNFIFIAEVMPSQRRNDECHHPWVSIDPSGNVLSAHCTCMAGLGESCSHVAALLFKIEAAVRLGYTQLTCTDKPCEWNNYFTSKVLPAPIKDIRFYREEVVTKVQGTGRKRRATAALEVPTYEEQQAFIHSLCDIKSEPVVLSTFAETCKLFKPTKPVPPIQNLPPPLRNLHQTKYLNFTENQLKEECNRLKANIKYSDIQTEYLAECTMAQSSTLTWHEQRAGRVTASFAHHLLHTDQDSPAQYVLKSSTQIVTAPIMAASLVYGRETEPKALALFKDTVDKFHTKGVVSKVGMKVHGVHPWLAASADGIVKCDCHGICVVEIKCPITARNTPPEEVISDPKSFMFTGQLKRTHKYFTQVQIQMAVYGVHFCDFLVYANNSLIHQQINRDDDFLNEMVPKLELFWDRHILPELLTRRVENCQEVTQSSDGPVGQSSTDKSVSTLGPKCKILSL